MSLDNVTVPRELLEQLIDSAEIISESYRTGALAQGRDSVRMARLVSYARRISARIGGSGTPTFVLDAGNHHQFKEYLRSEFFSPGAIQSKTDAQREFDEAHFFPRTQGFRTFEPKKIAFVTAPIRGCEVYDCGNRQITSDFEFFEYPGNRIAFFCQEANYVYQSCYSSTPCDFVNLLSGMMVR